MSKQVVIVGAGLGGLSAAALLAKKGYKVIVLEKKILVLEAELEFFEQKGLNLIWDHHGI